MTIGRNGKTMARTTEQGGMLHITPCETESEAKELAWKAIRQGASVQAWLADTGRWQISVYKPKER